MPIDGDGITHSDWHDFDLKCTKCKAGMQRQTSKQTGQVLRIRCTGCGLNLDLVKAAHERRERLQLAATTQKNNGHKSPGS